MEVDWPTTKDDSCHLSTEEGAPRPSAPRQIALALRFAAAAILLQAFILTTSKSSRIKASLIASLTRMRPFQSLVPQLRCVVLSPPVPRCAYRHNFRSKFGLRNYSTTKQTSSSPKPTPSKTAPPKQAAKANVAPRKPVKPVAAKPAVKYSPSQTWKPTAQKGMLQFILVYYHSTKLTVDSCAGKCPHISRWNRQDSIPRHVAYGNHIRRGRFCHDHCAGLFRR